MTLQWTFVATVLYAEIFIVSILMLPFISPKIWSSLFRSAVIKRLGTYSKIYFYIFIAILVLLFADSVREVMKYSETLDSEELRRYPEAETNNNMKMFRAQRNMYIAGFALFLWFILRRLVILIANEATLMAESEASFRQAQSATAAAQALLDDKSQTDDNKKNKETEKKSEEQAKEEQSALQKDLDETQAELEKTKEELYKANLDIETLKKQAANNTSMYDKLLEEMQKLQNKVTGSGTAEDKKDD